MGLRCIRFGQGDSKFSTRRSRKLNTSKKSPGRVIYLCLPLKLPASRVYHGWAMDISYTPAQGLIYLAAVIAGTAAECWLSGCRS